MDTGFLVRNEHTYPNLLRLPRQLDVPIAKSDLSFSAQVPHIGLDFYLGDCEAAFATRNTGVVPFTLPRD